MRIQSVILTWNPVSNKSNTAILQKLPPIAKWRWLSSEVIKSIYLNGGLSLTEDALESMAVK